MKIDTRQSSIHGTGVFATEGLRQAEIVLAIDDSRMVDDAHPVRFDLGEDGEHCDWLPDGTTVTLLVDTRKIF